MTDAEVGQYIRLMCIQANKGHVTKKDMLNICKTLDNEVILKFTRQSDGAYVNQVLAEIVEQRKNFTESRRNNRKGKKSNNTSGTHVNHVVNKDVIVNRINTIGEGKFYFIVDDGNPNNQIQKVIGVDGMNQFFETNRSQVNLPNNAEKFMRSRNGKKFKDFGHVWNDYKVYLEKL